MSSSLPSPGGALRLTDWGLIRAEGADAAKFLHGQLTQDVEHLRSDVARLAGYCSAKGRLLASFVVWRPQPDVVWLACSADLLANTLKRLKMFVLRAKCTLADAGADTVLYGLAGPAAADWLGAALPAVVWGVADKAGATVVRMPDAAGAVRCLLVQPATAEPPALPPLDADAWGWLEVHSGVTRVVAATVEQFVPQMVNLELVGGVNFQKGCYPGQEIVARSQYRGTLKRRALRFDADTTLSAGQEVFASTDPGQPAGMVALAAPRPGGGSSALVELKLAALDAGALHAGSPDGPLLSRESLPYAIPSDA